MWGGPGARWLFLCYFLLCGRQKKVKDLCELLRYTAHHMDASAQSPSGKKLALLSFVIILILGAIGTAAVLIIKGQSLDAARLLRPQETVAVFTHAERGAWKPYARMLPILEVVPPITSQNATLAIVKRGTTLGWVLLGDVPLIQAQGQLAFASPTVAYTSSLPDWKPAEDSETTLESYPPFLQLLAQAPNDTPVAYMDMQQLKAEARTALDTLLFNGAHQWPTVMLWTSGAQTQILLYGRTERAQGDFAQVFPERVRSNMLSVSVSNGADAWNALTSFVPERERLMLQGRLAAYVSKTLGPNVSVQYDLLPLLKNGASLSVTASGFVLEGHSIDLETEKSLTRIMESVHQNMPQSAVDRHTFERGFTSTIISPSSEAIVERRQSEQGFTIHTLWSVPQNRGIALARKGSLFRLATDFSLLMPKSTSDVPALEATRINSPLSQAEALVWVRGQSVAALLQQVLGMDAMSDVLPANQDLLLGLRREGTFTRIVIDQQP